MNNWIVISLLAGLAAAAMSASVLAPSVISFALFYLSAIPLFMAGLGWGPVAAGLAGVIGSAVLAIGMGVASGVFFAISSAAAPVALSYLAMINRPQSASGKSGLSEGEAAEQGREWYPEGRLVLWTAGFAIALVCVSVLFMGPDVDSFRSNLSAQIRPAFVELAKQMPEFDTSQTDAFVQGFVVLLPLLAASIWFLTTLFNMWAASRLLKIGNRSLRPWAPFHKLAFPKRSGLAIGLAALCAFVPGLIGLAGGVALAVLACAFTILGLAVIHSLTLGNPARPVMLGGLYGLLVMMNGILIVPLCGMALMDMYLNMRKRARSAGTPPDDDND